MTSPTSEKGSLLLDLPVELRRMIFNKLLIHIRPIYLFRDPTSLSGGLFEDEPTPFASGGNTERPITAYTSGEGKYWLALLRLNRQLKAEASDILYSCNSFYFQDNCMNDLPLVTSFLNQIGRSNAAQLSHLAVDFPSLKTYHLEQNVDLALSDEGSNVIEILGEYCTHLKIIEFTLYDMRNTRILISGIVHNLASARQLISHIDHQLKTNISTLKRISIGPWPDFGRTRLVEEFGWSTGIPRS